MEKSEGMGRTLYHMYVSNDNHCGRNNIESKIHAYKQTTRLPPPYLPAIGELRGWDFVVMVGEFFSIPISNDLRLFNAINWKIIQQSTGLGKQCWNLTIFAKPGRACTGCH